MFDNNMPGNAVMPQMTMPQMTMPQMAMPQAANVQMMPAAGCCIPQETFICNVKLATAYVPFQKLCSTFSPVEGLDRGTIFPELFSPYRAPGKCAKPLKHE